MGEGLMKTTMLMKSLLVLICLFAFAGSAKALVTNTWNGLETRLLSRHIGGGDYTVAAGDPGYTQYVSATSSAANLANDALSDYNDYNIQTNAAGEVTGGLAWSGYSKALATDFYGLGLAVHLQPGAESTTKARSFVRWLQWHGAPIDHWHYASIGRGAFLMKDALEASDIEFLRQLLFPSIDKHIDIMQNGLIDDTPGFRTADALRTQGGGILPAILMLPDDTDAERAIKRDYLDRARELILFAALPRSGVRGFFKPDRTGSHHLYNYASAYVPQGAAALASMAELLRGSDWQLSDAELQPIVDYVNELYFFAHHDHVPNGLSGRMFAASNIPSDSFHMVPHVIMAATQPAAGVLQLAANGDALGMRAFTYGPTYWLNQHGAPGDIAVMSKTLQIVDQQGVVPAFITGVRSYPYSPGMARRFSNWKAFVKGVSRWWWSYEGGITATNPEAVFGIYKSHGALEIRYYDPADPGGPTQNPMSRQGMDMSHRAGATTSIRSDVDMINDVIVSRLRINSTSVGGVELDQRHGIFMFDLKNTPADMKDNGFAARKSYFFLGDRIIMLGDNIQSASAGNYPVHTTLFQNFLNQGNRSLSPIYVDSAAPVTADSYTHAQPSLANSYALVDADGTGYYVPPGQHLHVERELSSWRQTTRLSGSDVASRQADAMALPVETAYRAFAWLDHGINPSGGGYEYAVLPGRDFAATDLFRQQQDLGQVYQVAEKSSRAHVVNDLENELWAYALYDDYASTSNGPLRGVSVAEVLPHADETVDAHPGYGVLIDESSDNRMDLAVSFLDLRMHRTYNSHYYNDRGPNNEKMDYASAPVNLAVDIEGIWHVVGQPSAVQAVEVVGDITRLTVQCVDGASINLSLKTGVNIHVATDDFQSNTWSDGTGWSGDWAVTTGSGAPVMDELAGNYCIKLTRGDLNHSITRTLMSPVSDGTLTFKWDVDSLDNPTEYAYAEVFDGTWHTVWSRNSSGNGSDLKPTPDNLQEASVDLSAYGSVTQVRFSMSSSSSSGDYFYVDDIALRIFVDSYYETWRQSYSLSDEDAALLADPDVDGLHNLGEYGLGGYPDQADLPAGILPEVLVDSSDGSNVMKMIYRRRRDAADRCLSYYLDLTETLDGGIWSTNGYTETGVFLLNADFELVTNSIPAGVSNGFIRLNIEID